jgi:tetratricopeptide (TPR) repeat protein
MDRYEHFQNLLSAGRTEDALEEIRSMLNSTSEPEEKAGLLLNEVVVLGKLGRLQEAKNSLVAARRVLPEKSKYRLRVDFHEACLCMDEHEYRDALTKFDHLLRNNASTLTDPEELDLYQAVQIKRGILLAECERPKEARVILEKALSFDIEPAEKAAIYYHLGVCHFDLGEMQPAKERLVRALELGLDDDRAGQAHYHLGIACYREGAYAKAKVEFESVLRMDASDVPKRYVFEWLARTSSALGLEDEARRYERLAKEQGG